MSKRILRILIEDHSLNSFIVFSVQEYKEKNSFRNAKKIWTSTKSSLVSITNQVGFDSCINDLKNWKIEYPDAKIVNTSKLFPKEMSLEKAPFKTELP